MQSRSSCSVHTSVQISVTCRDAVGQLPCALEQKLLVESFSCPLCWSPTWAQLWHIWSSGSSSCVRPGCRNAVLQCFSCVLWPHLHVGVGITRIRHGNCRIQWQSCTGFFMCTARCIAEICIPRSTAVCSWSSWGWAGEGLCAHPAVCKEQLWITVPHCFPSYLLRSPSTSIFLLSDPCCWSTISFM